LADCQVKDAPDPGLGQTGGQPAQKATGSPAIFLADKTGPTMPELIRRSTATCRTMNERPRHPDYVSGGGDAVFAGTVWKNGKDTISVTGKCLAGLLTRPLSDLEIGTSAKMLSIVPLLTAAPC